MDRGARGPGRPGRRPGTRRRALLVGGGSPAPPLVVALALLAGCGAGGAGGGRAGGYPWHLPAGFPEPAVPRDNPMSPAKVALGRRLFYDTRLSIDGEVSCASCHRQALAFTDGRARALGATGELHPRSTMSLTNVAYAPVLTWADAGVRSLERQLAMPLFAVAPVEMGLAGRGRRVEGTLAADPEVAALFASAFPRDPRPVRLDNARRALASFERTLISGGSRYDRWLFWGEREALSAPARRGMTLFFSPRAGCSRCHGGFNLSGPVVYRGSPAVRVVHHNTNLYAAGDPRGAPGLAAHSGRGRDEGAFRAPTLRNIAVTAPYMHDGGIATLGEVVAHYAAGGRARPVHPRRSPLLRELALTARERADLVAFLEALTDEGFLTEPRFADPRAQAGEATDGERLRTSGPRQR